jgi:hypothetical protein
MWAVNSTVHFFKPALPHWYGIRRKTFHTFGLLDKVYSTVAESRLTMVNMVVEEWETWSSGDCSGFMFRIMADLFGTSYTTQFAYLILKFYK